MGRNKSVVGFLSGVRSFSRHYILKLSLSQRGGPLIVLLINYYSSPVCIILLFLPGRMSCFEATCLLMLSG